MTHCLFSFVRPLKLLEDRRVLAWSYCVRDCGCLTAKYDTGNGMVDKVRLLVAITITAPHISALTHRPASLRPVAARTQSVYSDWDTLSPVSDSMIVRPTNHLPVNH